MDASAFGAASRLRVPSVRLEVDRRGRHAAGRDAIEPHAEPYRRLDPERQRAAPALPQDRGGATAAIRVLHDAGDVGRRRACVPGSGASHDGRASRSGVPSRPSPSRGGASCSERRRIAILEQRQRADRAAVRIRPVLQSARQPRSVTVARRSSDSRKRNDFDLLRFLELIPVDPVLLVQLAALARFPDLVAREAAVPQLRKRRS